MLVQGTHIRSFLPCSIILKLPNQRTESSTTTIPSLSLPSRHTCACHLLRVRASTTAVAPAHCPHIPVFPCVRGGEGFFVFPRPMEGRPSMGPVRTSLASFHVVVGLGVILACIMAVRGDTTQATPGEPATASSSLCPAGFACDNAGQITSACEVGKASALGQTSCHTCPDGYYADTIGMKACSECPAGYECPNQAYPPALCVAGTFSRGRTTACAPCPSLVGEDGRAAYCPPGSTATTLCPEGFFCTGVESAVEPQACPAGYYCPLGSFTPIICPVGAYCPANAVVPTACPKGTRRTNGARPGGATFAASCAVCPFGTYGRAAAEGAPVPATCADCAAGYVCRKGASSPTPEVLSRDGGNRCESLC